MAWSDAARAAALAARRAHSVRQYGVPSRGHAAAALRRARTLTVGMGKYRNVATRRYAYQMLTKGGARNYRILPAPAQKRRLKLGKSMLSISTAKSGAMSGGVSLKLKKG